MPAEPAAAERRAEHAARADHQQGPDQDRLLPGRLQPRVQRRRLAPAQGRRRRPAHDQRRGLDLSRAATCCSTGARRSSTTAAQTGTGTYGYYEVNDRGTRGAVDANMPSLYVQDTWTVGNRLTLNLGVRTEQRDDPVVPDRHQGRRVRVRLRQEDRAAPRRDLRRARRRPAEGVRQLGPLLRLGQVRAGARLVRRRHLAGELSLARHARRLQPEPRRTCRAAISGAASRDRRVPNFDTIDPDLKPMFQDATNLGHRVSAERRRPRSASTTCTTS